MRDMCFFFFQSLYLYFELIKTICGTSELEIYVEVVIVLSAICYVYNLS